MSSTILSTDLTVYYLDEARQKRITWTGTATGTRTMNELYSALQDLFDEPTQMDDGSPMSAETPVEYTIGIIDAGDLNPWYIDYSTVQHLTNGALRTAGWTRDLPGDGTGAIGIVVVPVATAGAIVAGDVGFTISHAAGDAGTLLDVIVTGGATDYLVVRPDTNTLADDFNTASGNLTCNAHVSVQNAVAHTGEQVWANLYSIGTIEPDTHIYVYQGTASDGTRARVYDITDSTQDWWTDGQVDRLFFINDYTASGFPAIDAGNLKVFARKYGTLYDNFEVVTSLTSGGRNPIPLATAPDLDNTTGYASITFTASTGVWSVGDEMQGDTSGARAIITQIDTPGATQTVHYYLIDDPQTDFNTAAENLTNNDDTGTGTKNTSAPAAQGPALATWFTNNAAPSAAYANTTVDINDDGTAEGYGITLNCNSNPLTEVYEWIKYIFRRGEVTTGNSDGIEAEQYVGAEVYLEYSGTVTGTISEGSDVTQATSGATGTVISHDVTLKQILLRDTRGTFNTANIVTDNDVGGTVTPNIAAATFSPKKAAPLGTFAGGTFFGGRGVVLSNWVAGDENSFQLTDAQGVIRQRPVAISITITNLVGGAESVTTSDTVSVFRLTGAGGSVDKTEHSCAGGELIGDATVVVDVAIPADVPGKTTGGVLHIRDASDANKQYRLRFSSWTGSTFTLANIDIVSADAGTNTTTIVEAGLFATAKRGDLVLNKTRANAVSYVTEVTDANTVQIFPAIAGQTTADAIEINAVPVALNTADDLFVALIDQYATGTQASVSIVYSSPIDYRVVVRNQRNATKIRPFTTDDATTGDNRSVATIRTTDTIAA